MRKGEMLGNAIIIATNAHADQYDRGGVPYILHPLKVMHYLKSDDEELQCVAVLHDVVEDTKVTYKDLREDGMSERVINAVKALTKVPGETAEEYLNKVLSNFDACRVKLCDLRHNSDIRRLKGITEKDLTRNEKYHRMHAAITNHLTNKEIKDAMQPL